MKVLLTLLAIGFSISLVAQPKFDDFEIEMGPFFKVGKRSVPVEFIGNDGTGFYLAYARGKTGFGEVSLSKFGYNLQLIRELKLAQSIEGQMAYSEAIFIVEDRMYHFLRSTFLNEQKIYLQEIDKEKLTFSVPVLVTTISGTGNVFSSDRAVHIASDSSHIAFVYTIPNKKKENEELGVHVFDSNMKEVWNKRFELPYTNKLLDLSTYRVDVNGKLNVLGKRYFEKRKNQVAGEVNYDYLLFGLDRTGAIDSFKIETEGKYLKDMQVDITSDGKIISAGFYSEQSSALAGGAFYLQIDGKTKEMISSSFKEFEAGFLTQNMKEGKAKRIEKKLEKGKDVELPFYFIDEFIIDDDGRTKIIAESRHIYTTYTYTQYGSVATTHFDYDDVMVIDIDPSGNINWARRIAKSQHTINDLAAYSSYSTSFTNKDLFLIFNDNVDNLNYSGSGKVAAMKKGSSTMVMVNKVSANGEMKRSALFNRSEVDTKVRPALCKQISEDTMLLFGHKGLKTQRFILLKFK